MSRLRRLWPYGVLLLLALLAAEPLARESVTCSDDGPFHLYRAVQLEWLLRAGHWLPRWAPHMAQGYGYPLYLFTAPLSSYFLVGLHALGIEYPAALKVAFALTIWLAGCAACLFVRDEWGERAGIVAGGAYLFAPYFAFDVLYRANLAESFAFIWPPLVLWALRRGLRADAPRWALPLAAASYAALVLTHNVFAFISSPLLAGYVAVLAWQRRSWRVLIAGAMSLLLGAVLSAYYWIPALAEQSLVHSERLLVAPIFTWDTNFITLDELLAAPRAEDPLLVNPSPPRTLGLVAALLCLPAGYWLLRRRARRAEVAFFALALIGYAALTLPLTEPVWRVIHPLELIQFPWRLLGPAALCAAILIGAGVRALERLPRVGRAMPVLVTALFVFGHWAWWYPRYCAAPATASLRELIEYERATATIGTTAKGEFLPLTVEYLPDDTTLAEAIARGEEPVRLQVIDGDAELTALSARDPLDAAFTVTARAPATLVYRQFLYPGWQIAADGQPIEPRPAQGTGLITFDLSAGTHRVHITFGSTPLRTVAALISMLALLALGALFVARRSIPVAHVPSTASVWDLGMLAVTLLVLKVAVIDRVPNPLRHTRFDGVSVAGLQTPLRADFAGGLRLYGYDLVTRRLPGDGGVDVALYIGKRAPNIRDFAPVFVLHDSQGVNWIGADAFIAPRWHRAPPPSYDWPDDGYAQWARRLTVLPGTPPGEYELKLELIDRSDGAMQSVLDEQGNAIQPRLSFGTLTVTRPAQPYRLQPENVLNADLGPITLLGYGIDRTTASSGDPVLLTLYWRSDEPATRDFDAHLRIGDFTVTLPPVDGYGTSQWQPDDEWRGQHRVMLPANLPGGAYPLQLSLADQSTTLGAITVTAPARIFAAPSFEKSLDVTFDGAAELVGYTLTRDGVRVKVTLVWKATATPAQRYAVFVHLGDAARVFAQSDSQPAGGARPTTGWLAGEYIVDEHALTLPDDLPAGDYTMYVGMYDPQTSVRVLATGGAPDNRTRIGTLVWP